MRSFSLTDLVNFSNIKAHTFRVWEKRYNILVPKRQHTSNFRYYTLDDIDYLLKISLLNKSGIKISRLATMNALAIEKSLLDLRNVEYKQRHQVNKLIICMFSMNTEEFDSTLDSCILSWGIDVTIRNIIIPFLEQTQVLSCKNCDIEMDFVVTSIRKKMIVGIDNINGLTSNFKSILLFLPEGEYYDLILLYYNYLFKNNGFNVLYMGSNISMEKIKSVTNKKQPEFLVTYVSPKHKMEIGKLKNYLAEHLPKATLFVTGLTGQKIHEQEESNLKFMHYSELAVQ